MTLFLHNTATRCKEPFRPRNPESVGLYVCGPTVHDLAHLGNARPVVVFDVLYRLLSRSFGRVVHVRNITDVDDKILEAARRNGEEPGQLAARVIRAFHRDMAALGALPPDIEPMATGHIPGMIAMIARLLERGVAYEAGGHVLFHVPSFPGYGRLSGRSREELVAGARVEVAPWKRDPGDFVLWKPGLPDFPGWDSPWGRGRPGWHIECSAMALAHLGTSFDIHGGGADLLFPHHENECAQSEAANGVPPARFWVHNGMVTVEGRKMSKSLGNVLTVRGLLAQAPGEAVRLALLSVLYRQPLDWTAKRLHEAREILDRWYSALAVLDEKAGDSCSGDEDGTGEGEIHAALRDDLNTPAAIAAMHRLASEALAVPAGAGAARLRRLMREGGAIMGLLGHSPAAWLHGEDSPLRADIGELVAKRRAAREKGDFAEADRIRDSLAGAGILLEDRADGSTVWRRRPGASAVAGSRLPDSRKRHGTDGETGE